MLSPTSMQVSFTEGMKETCIEVGDNIISCGIRRAMARRENENAVR